ncbi:MAG: YfhO family protein [Ruminococcus sp.]|nr:YfhO family protein [Ruminococcus sp.]
MSETRAPLLRRIEALFPGKKIYLLIFIIPIAVMYITYAAFGVHPYGNNSVLVLDLNGQYVYYYEALRDSFWGDGSLMYDWSRNLSGEMFGIFAYYLASPFMLIICLLPRTWMCGAVEMMILTKIGCSAVTFAFFMRKRHNPSNTALIVFSSCYALMSYMVVQTMDPMWLDGLILLPLICHGCHRLMEEGKMVPYIVPLALMFISHFYIGYMVAFFTFCYFIFVSFSQPGRIVPKHFGVRFLQAVAATVTALMIAAIVLIPVYNSLKLGKFEFTTPNWSLATQFDMMTFITKLFPMTYDTVYPKGLPMIYCGSAVLLLVPLFFLNKRIPIKEKVSKVLLASVLVICMYIKPIDIVWHGFQVPNWLPYRYSFCFSFVLLLMAYRAWEESDGFTVKEIGGVFAALMAFLFWCERENYEHFQIFEARTEGEKKYGVIQGIWFSAIALAVFFLLIYLWKRYKGHKVLSVAIVLLFSMELMVNAMDTVHKIDKDVAYSKYDSYEPYMSDTRDAIENLRQFDDSPFYRVESTFHRTVNDPIGTDYMGVSHSSSTMNSPALTMLHQLGYAYGGHYIKYDGETLITDALFDIKYIMTKDEYEDRRKGRFKDGRNKIPKDYHLATHIDEQEAQYQFYKNPYALGLGLAADPKVLEIVLSDTDPFENQEIILNSLISSDSDYEFFHKLRPYKLDDENLRKAPLVDGHVKYQVKDQTKAECHVDYVVRMDRDSELYMFLPTKYERSVNVWYQPEDLYQAGETTMEFGGQFFVGDNYSILNLGEFTEGESVRIRITIANDDKEAFWLDEYFCTFDREAFKQAIDQLKTRTWELTTHEDKYVEGKVTATAGQYLFTTIPYEEGWEITVNGKDVKPLKSLDALITIPLEEGENTVTMSFAPNYHKLAVIITISGFIILLLIFFLEYKEGRMMRRLFVKAELRGVKAEDKPQAEAAVPPVIPDSGPDEDDDLGEIVRSVIKEDQEE